jgi:hypothetical protein
MVELSLECTPAEKPDREHRAVSGQVVHTYHELAVGNKLHEVGFSIEYEWQVFRIRQELSLPEIEGNINRRTPDWFVRAPDGTPAFILDVFTADMPGQQPMDTAEITRLKAELEALDYDVELVISPPRNDFTLPRDFSTLAAAKVNAWLKSSTPETGAKYLLEVKEPGTRESSAFEERLVGTAYPAKCALPPRRSTDYKEVIFTVGRSGVGLSHVRAHMGPSPFFVDEETMCENFVEKTEKYAAADLPLVVAVVADPMTGVSEYEFRSVLLGQQKMEFEWDGNSIVEKPGREPNGVFSSPPNADWGPAEDTRVPCGNEVVGRALSAGVLLERLDDGRWTLVSVVNPNPDAIWPLQSGLFTWDGNSREAVLHE